MTFVTFKIIFCSRLEAISGDSLNHEECICIFFLYLTFICIFHFYLCARALIFISCRQFYLPPIKKYSWLICTSSNAGNITSEQKYCKLKWKVLHNEKEKGREERRRERDKEKTKEKYKWAVHSVPKIVFHRTDEFWIPAREFASLSFLFLLISFWKHNFLLKPMKAFLYYI